jgi:CRISPR system Cascade subunit CasB
MNTGGTGPGADFIQHLISLLGSSQASSANSTSARNPDRAALAALRRGLGKRPGEVAEMFPYVIPWCSHLTEHRQDDYFLVAALFALHQGTTGPNPTSADLLRNNFGASFRQVADRSGSSSIEKRFLAVLSASREELDDHLRHAVSLMRANNVGIDWAQLLRDLSGWNSPARYVQRHWAQGYWQMSATQQAIDVSASASATN